MATVKSCRIIVVAIAVWTQIVVAGTYSGGLGELDDPYLIATPEDMNAIGACPEDWDKCFLLVNDVNLACFTGTQFNMIGDFVVSGSEKNRGFTGVFNGNGRKITHFTWSGEDREAVGIFSCIEVGGCVSDLTVEDVCIDALDCTYVGAIAGNTEKARISNCCVSGSISGSCSFVGGLTGSNYGTVILNCRTDMIIASSGDIIGGTAGTAEDTTIIDCLSNGVVWGYFAVGGLVGVNLNDGSSGIIVGCQSSAQVQSLTELSGGLIAVNDGGRVVRCSAHGDVSGWRDVGGLVGMNWPGLIDQCISTGKVSVDGSIGNDMGGDNPFPLSDGGTLSEAGGLIGLDAYGVVRNSYACGEVSGCSSVGGLIGATLGGTLVSQCYSRGSVQGDWDTGGLVGVDSGEADEQSVFTSSFWDVNESSVDVSAGGEGKSTIEMMDSNTFLMAGWDFVGEDDNGQEDVWTIASGRAWPRLVWEVVDLSGEAGVNFEDYAVVLKHWGQSGCENHNDCNGADIDFSGVVDWVDLSAMAQNWLGN